MKTFKIFMCMVMMACMISCNSHAKDDDSGGKKDKKAKRESSYSMDTCQALYDKIQSGGDISEDDMEEMITQLTAMESWGWDEMSKMNSLKEIEAFTTSGKFQILGMYEIAFEDYLDYNVPKSLKGKYSEYKDYSGELESKLLYKVQKLRESEGIQWDDDDSGGKKDKKAKTESSYSMDTCQALYDKIQSGGDISEDDMEEMITQLTAMSSWLWDEVSKMNSLNEIEAFTTSGKLQVLYMYEKAFEDYLDSNVPNSLKGKYSEYKDYTDELESKFHYKVNKLRESEGIQ